MSVQYHGWTAAAITEQKFVGKRLSEIARMALSPETLTESEQHIAMTALALGWLDIVDSGKDHYGQQVRDRG